jgi:hypothetical protein
MISLGMIRRGVKSVGTQRFDGHSTVFFRSELMNNALLESLHQLILCRIRLRKLFEITIRFPEKYSIRFEIFDSIRYSKIFVKNIRIRFEIRKSLFAQA